MLLLRRLLSGRAFFFLFDAVDEDPVVPPMLAVTDLVWYRLLRALWLRMVAGEVRLLLIAKKNLPLLKEAFN